MSNRSSVHLWDTFSGHSDIVLADGTSELVTFDPADDPLATSHDGNVDVWRMPITDPDLAIQHICRSVNHDLTKAEQSSYLTDAPAQRSVMCNTSKGPPSALVADATRRNCVTGRLRH
ncbi:hypothetical protein [Streptomyces mayteni]